MERYYYQHNVITCILPGTRDVSNRKVNWYQGNICSLHVRREWHNGLPVLGAATTPLASGTRLRRTMKDDQPREKDDWWEEETRSLSAGLTISDTLIRWADDPSQKAV